MSDSEDLSEIDFYRNYNNKLDNRIFTSIRKDFDVVLRELCLITIGEVDICEATVVGKMDFDRLDEVPRHTLRLDTGMLNTKNIFDKFQEFGLEKDDSVTVLTLYRVDKATPPPLVDDDNNDG